MRKIFKIIQMTAKEVLSDKVLTYAAAIAFYTALSLPPLLMLLVWALSGFSPGAEQHIQDEAAALIGSDGAELIRSILDSADQRVSLSGVSGWIGAFALLFAASGVFAQLQKALNRIWEVEAKPGGGVIAWIRKRFLSFGLVGVLAFLAAASLATSVILGATGVDTDAEDVVAMVLNNLASLALFTLLFSAVFKFLPDVVMQWRDVLGGAFVTALLFSVSKYVIGFYLAQKGLGSAYGAAGSAVVVLVWVYFSTAVVLVGAEITQAWLRANGRLIKPNKYAVAFGTVDSADSESTEGA